MGWLAEQLLLFIFKTRLNRAQKANQFARYQSDVIVIEVY